MNMQRITSSASRAAAISLTSIALFSCEKAIDISNADSENPIATRVAKSNSSQLLFWKDGYIPYQFEPSVTSPQRALVKNAIASWQTPLQGVLRFEEVTGTYTGRSLTIGLCPGYASGSMGYAYVAGDKLCLSTEWFNTVTAQNPDPSGYINWLDNSTYFPTSHMVRHEIGHVIGLQHEQGHPRIREFVTTDLSQAGSGCPMDPFTGWEEKSGVVAGTLATSTPDMSSVMFVGYSTMCASGNIIFRSKADGKIVGSSSWWTGPSASDIQTVRSIYLSTSTPRKWNPATPITLEVVYNPSGTFRPQETAIKTHLSSILYRWTSLLDPALGPLAAAPKQAVNVAPDQVTTAPAKIRVIVEKGTGLYRSICSSGLPTTSCTIWVNDSVNAEGQHLLSNGYEYLSNVLQAATGGALGLYSGDLNSALNVTDRFQSQLLIPTQKDIRNLKALYGSTGDYATLIRVRADNGNTRSTILTSLEDFLVTANTRSALDFVDVIGRAAKPGSAMSTWAPGSPLKSGLVAQQYQMPWYTAYGNKTIAAAMPTSCPQEAKDAGNLVVPKGNLNAFVFDASQSFANVPLYAIWDSNAKFWNIATLSSAFTSCQFVIGYIVTK